MQNVPVSRKLLLLWYLGHLPVLGWGCLGVQNRAHKLHPAFCSLCWEGKFLQDNISSDQFWVGASRKVGADYTSPSSWTWSDGTAMNYTAWTYGQPNNAGIFYGERCVKSVEREGEKKWDDHRCWMGITRAFVCKLQLQWSLRRDGELLSIHKRIPK